MKVVLATHNQHKAEEIATILSGVPVELVSLGEFPDAPDVDETGDTLEANALLKADSAVNLTGLASAADDTGLFVDALGGAPGVRSARFAGPECSYQKNNAKLLADLAHLADLEGLAQEARTARFECVVALVVPRKPPLFFKGVLPGRIVEVPRGQNGFGYDPLFKPDGMDTTLAEISAEAKNAISHRCIAFRRLGDLLRASANQD